MLRHMDTPTVRRARSARSRGRLSEIPRRGVPFFFEKTGDQGRRPAEEQGHADGAAWRALRARYVEFPRPVRRFGDAVMAAGASLRKATGTHPRGFVRDCTAGCLPYVTTGRALQQRVLLAVPDALPRAAHRTAT